MIRVIGVTRDSKKIAYRTSLFCGNVGMEFGVRKGKLVWVSRTPECGQYDLPKLVYDKMWNMAGGILRDEVNRQRG